jgi:TonB-linked SusC/RagA family outer membrane protein
VKGQVLESEGKPISKVKIILKGRSAGAESDENGNFSINVMSDKDTLIFRAEGFNELQMRVENRSVIKVIMESSFLEQETVVVTALGLERKSKELGYAVQELKEKEISEVKAANFLDNLSGKVAGVTVTQGPTGVGSSSKITIRGEASFTNNNPLFVVDGIIINNNSINNITNDASAGFQTVDFGNGAMDINADDIESVSVLKGPSAAALYGTRASNGVILITTKSANKGGKLGISFNSTTYFEKPFQLPKFQNKYGQGNSGEFEYKNGLGGGINDNISYSWGPELDQGNLIAQYDSPVTIANGQVVQGGDTYVHGGNYTITPTEFKSYKDNLKNFYQTGMTTINNASISNSFEKGSYRLSFTDLRSQSVIPGTDFLRKNIAARMTFDPTDKLKISTSINYVNSESDNRPAGGYGSENVNYALVAWGPRSLDISQMERVWQPGLEGLQQYSFNYIFFDNPYLTLFENKNVFNKDRVFGNVVATYSFTKKFSLTTTTGMDFANEHRTFKRSYSTNRFKTGAYAEHNVFFRENNTDIHLDYKSSFEHISIEYIAGANRMDQQASTFQAQALSLAQPGVFSLTNAASPAEIFQFNRQKRINSVYGLVKFGFKNYLYVDITGRNDWSSALATPTNANNISFFYPSISSSLIVSNLLKLPKIISFAKLRASFAQVGNDTDPYQTSQSFAAQTPYLSQATFSAQSTVPNSNLKPESTSSFEVGTDIRFFGDRLAFDFTYFNSNTKNQIISLPVPISSGYNQQIVNGGLVKSTGIEIVSRVEIIRKENFKWNTTLNFSTYRSTVEELPEGIEKLTLGYSSVYDNVNQTVWVQVEKGGRIGDLYGTGYKKTSDGQFIIDANGNFIADNTLKKLGNYNPDFILTLNNGFQYKQFNFGFLVDWRQGGILVSRTLALAGVAGQLIETENRPTEGIVAEGVVNIGTTENPEYVTNTKAISAESYYRQYYDRNHEENNTYDASYLKLRQLSFGYTFKSKSEDGYFANGRSLTLSIIARNVFAISKIPHFDPEQMAIQQQKFVGGVEDMSYASVRSIGFKLGFNF